MKSFKEYLNEFNETYKFKKGDKVIVKNMKRYDAFSKDDEAKGIVDFIWSDGRIAVNIGNGQTNAKLDDIVLDK